MISTVENIPEVKRPQRRAPLASIALGLGALIYVWAVVIRHLSIEWSVNDQYAYGWAVPLLCLYLVWRKLKNFRFETALNPSPHVGGYVCIGVLLMLYFPTRLVEEANPEWRLVSWALSLEAVGVTLLLARSVLGPASARIIFPIAFFLVAVPWPSFIETPLIRGLSQANAASTVELLSLAGTPALQRGNVIEISTGIVDIDEACSGIRSFQAALMIALFFGEVYCLNIKKRFSLVLSGFALSLVFNVLRTWLLITVAARTSPAVMMKSWHDPAGVGVLLACFSGVWALAFLLRKKRRDTDARPELNELNRLNRLCEAFRVALSQAPIGIVLAGWICLSEVGVEAWYRAHEGRTEPQTSWTVLWPKDLPTYKEIPMTDAARRMLRYGEAHNASWTDDGLQWQMILLHWGPGRTAARLATGHTPEVCLTAAGRKPVVSPEVKTFEVGRLSMPFRRYDLEQEDLPLHVFYCLWNDRDAGRFSKSMSITYAARFRPALRGERNTGQRSIEIAIWGAATGTQAEEAVSRELQKIINVKQ